MKKEPRREAGSMWNGGMKRPCEVRFDQETNTTHAYTIRVSRECDAMAVHASHDVMTNNVRVESNER